MATKRHSDNQGKTGKVGGNSELIVGRKGSSGLNIEMTNEMVSGRHLKLVKMGSMVIIEDLGSTNGTTVDGVPLRQGEQKPISINSNVILAQSEKLDFNHPLIRPLFEGVSTPQPATPTNGGGGTSIHKTPLSTPPYRGGGGGSRGEKIRPIHAHSKFYPPSYNLEEERECRGERELIMIRIFSKDSSKLRVIVFGAESEELVFNEEHSFTADLDNLRDADEKRKFFKNEIKNLLHIHKKRYCREEIWHHVLTSDGKYKDGGYYKLVSEKFENRLRTKVYINDKHYKRANEEEKLEFEDAELIDIRAKEVHAELAHEYQEAEKEIEFPVSVGWLNAILKRLPFYKKNPMHAFYLFCFSLLFIFLGLTYFSDTRSPKITSKNVDKKWIVHGYYANIAEPIWGMIGNKCLEASEVNWIINGKKDGKFKKECQQYCHIKVKLIKDATCDMLFPNRAKTEQIISERRYQVVIPEGASLGKNTPPININFINNTNQDMAVTVTQLDIALEDNKQFPGILESIRGGNTFAVQPNGVYAYQIVFNSSYIGQLKPEQTEAKITFQITFKNEASEIISKTIKLEI